MKTENYILEDSGINGGYLVSKNSKKIILDLCGGTGSWSKPYKDAGYDVRLITLPDNDVLTYEAPENVYGILAAPPCTMFSLARQNAKTPRDFQSAMKVVSACMNIIWKARIANTLKFWALENPRGYLRQFLGAPKCTFEHWMFVENSQHCKPTDLWGYFNIPRNPYQIKPELNKNRNRRVGNWQKPLPPTGYEHIIDRAAIRAITPAGFALAFYKANL